MLKILSLAALCTLSTAALAADSDQEILLEPPQSTAEAPQESAPLAHRISLGIGSGVNNFTGNMGKLYSHSSAVLDVRGEWAFTPVFGARVGADLAGYSFNAQPSGAVEVKTQSLQAAAQVHFLSTALISSGFDPYATAGGSATFRTQTFQDYNSVEKDNAVGLNAGMGTNYLMAGGKLGLFAEATAGQIFFADRYEQAYLESGLADSTGMLLTGRLGVKYYF